MLVHAAAESPPLVQDHSDTQFHTTSGATGDAFCDTLCQQFKDGQMVSSIGSTIEGYIAAGGLNGGHSDHRYDIIRGSHVSSGSDGSCGNEPSSIWKLWAQAHAHAFPNQLNNLGSEAVGVFQTGTEGNATFDAKKQLIDVSGSHAWQAPGPNDARGPCPGLNALANHGYLPRDGFATIFDFDPDQVFTHQICVSGETRLEGFAGQTYVVLTGCKDFITDDTVAAGPAIIEVCLLSKD